MFSLFHELSSFITRVYAVIKNTIQQLASLYHIKQKIYTNSFKGVHLQTVFGFLSELLTVLITLDEIIISNPTFNDGLTMYKRYYKYYNLLI
jgi:hypothetical protein